MFRGIVNRPVIYPAREFVIEQADKVEKFLIKLRAYAKEKKFETRVTKLAKDFKTHGATDINIKLFHILDTEIKECILSAAKKVAKKKFGYQQSYKLTNAGAEYHFWKAV